MEVKSLSKGNVVFEATTRNIGGGVGEVLVCEGKSESTSDRNTMARKLLRVCYY